MCKWLMLQGQARYETGSIDQVSCWNNFIRVPEVKSFLCSFRTSLMLAAGHKSKGTVRLLLQKGVDVCLKDHSGRTALSYAVNCSDNL